MESQKKTTRCEVGQGLKENFDKAAADFSEKNYIIYFKNDKGRMQRGEIHSKYQILQENFRQTQSELISHDNNCPCMEVVREN